MEWIETYNKMLNDVNVTYEEINEYLKGYRPTKLYRYRNYGFNWERELEYGEIYMACPKDFNDPFDCSLYFNRKNFGEYIKSKLNLIINDEAIDNSFNQMYNNNYEKYFNAYINQARIASFIPDYKSILMWSHYAGSHEGYCIEYDISKIDTNKNALFPVVYMKNRFDMSLIINDSDNMLMNPLLYKAQEWSYEKEWRLISSSEKFNKELGQCFVINNAITGIYLGARSDVNSNVQIIIKWAEKNKIPIYQMRVSKSQYALIKERL